MQHNLWKFTINTHIISSIQIKPLMTNQTFKKVRLKLTLLTIVNTTVLFLFVRIIQKYMIFMICYKSFHYSSIFSIRFIGDNNFLIIIFIKSNIFCLTTRKLEFFHILPLKNYNLIYYKIQIIFRIRLNFSKLHFMFIKIRKRLFL